MRLGVLPDTIGERLALSLGVVPTPLLHTLVGLTLARAIMVATKLGVFDVLETQPLTVNEIATRCEANSQATKKLLDALVSSDLLRLGVDGYKLSPTSRKWLVEKSPTSLRDAALSFLAEADRLKELEGFVKSGKAVDFHRSRHSPEEWSLYQRGMRALAALSAEECARRIPAPASARNLLDIGGSHGLYSVVLCRRYSELRAVILDLPTAVEHAAPLLAREGMGERVRHVAGDARNTDLGVEAYDIILMSQLAHHFSESENRELARRVAAALRPGGVFVLQELIRRKSPTKREQVGGLMDLWFALTSESGTWSFEEMVSWQRDAGLIPQKPLRLRTLPSAGQQAAIKPADWRPRAS